MEKKKYIDSNGNLWNGLFIDVGDTRVFNPSAEQLAQEGYTEVTETEGDLVEAAKKNKLAQIAFYDSSRSVDSFTIGGQVMWLTVTERQQIATQISANEAAGRDTMTRWFGGHEYTFPLSTWKQMLVALEVYAGDAINVTESHKAAINAMTSIELIADYDITQGYPQKLNF